jgi:hypothetical protein
MEIFAAVVLFSEGKKILRLLVTKQKIAVRYCWEGVGAFRR